MRTIGHLPAHWGPPGPEAAPHLDADQRGSYMVHFARRNLSHLAASKDRCSLHAGQSFQAFNDGRCPTAREAIWVTLAGRPSALTACSDDTTPFGLTLLKGPYQPQEEGVLPQPDPSRRYQGASYPPTNSPCVSRFYGAVAPTSARGPCAIYVWSATESSNPAPMTRYRSSWCPPALAPKLHHPCRRLSARGR